MKILNVFNKILIVSWLLIIGGNAYGLEINNEYFYRLGKIKNEIDSVSDETYRVGKEKYDSLVRDKLFLEFKDRDFVGAYINKYINLGYYETALKFVAAKDKISSSNSSKIEKDIGFSHLDRITNEVESARNKIIKLNNEFIIGKIDAAEHNEISMSILRQSKLNLKNSEEKFASELRDINSSRANRLPNSDNWIIQKRDLARDDVIAQVLNYASGVPEDASGDTFFYPANIDNGQCVYKIAINNNNMTGEVMNSLVQASKFLSANGISGGGQTASIMEDGIDLNKGDLKRINFYKLQGAQRNKFTGVTAYLRYQSRVEGLPDLFECDSNSCNIDRLKRGWSLVASKCKGTKKAF